VKKLGKGWRNVYPQQTHFYLSFFTSVPILVKIHKEMRAWECAQTDTRMHADGHMDRGKLVS